MTTIAVAMVASMICALMVRSMVAVNSRNMVMSIAVQMTFALLGSYRLWTFTAAVGVGFEIEYKFQQRMDGESSFAFSFNRVEQFDEEVCPYPLLRSSVNITNVPDIERLGPIPCYCDDEAYVVVGTEPVHITSPEFPLTHCSEVSTIRLNDTNKNVRLVLTGDIMETEFVTDNSIGQYGYNMTVESIHLPNECLCPHKGVKTMPIKADARMDIPEYCVTVYCEWIIPSITHDMVILMLFSSKSRVLARKEWKLPENSPPVTISYKRDVRANSTLPSAMTSFLVSWMPSEGCYCDNSSIKIAVVGEWDVLTSPAYPLSYCNDMLCVTRIVAPEG
ncbi:unnamed protein product [Haemonchus placei]|uniref:GUB_WAK_bind domain-containing protein n=1 Tax=Haemonchus placei TaxID=6290 RepID=A0A0N4WZ15_HAEPC|nr:unnamed protein product [Haemonchus placei]